MSNSAPQTSHTPGYFQNPQAFEDRIVFTAEEDLWLSTLSTPSTTRLTQGAHVANAPCVFSHDGQSIAFIASPDGVQDLYLLPLSGGASRRLTHNGYLKRVVLWSKSQLLCISAHDCPFGQGALYQVSLQNGALTPLSYGPVEDASINPDNPNQLVLSRRGYGYVGWKRYHGGTAADLWVRCEEGKKFQKLLTKNANLLHPRWHHGRIYFLSDFQDHGNVYSCTTEGQDLQRHTHHEDYYVRGFCITQHELIYSHAGTLKTIGLQRNTPPTPLPVVYPSPLSHKTQDLDLSQELTTEYILSEDGQFFGVIKRGSVFVLPTWQGGAHGVFKAEGKRYKHLCFIPKPKQFVSVMDNGFEDSVVLFAKDHASIEQHISLPKSMRITHLAPSPDGNTFLLADCTHTLWLLDKKGTLTRLDHSNYSEITDLTWCPDSHYVAYSKQTAKHVSQIFIRKLSCKQPVAITSELCHSFSPKFDTDGRYLVFLSQDHYQASHDPMCFQYGFSHTVQAYICPLQAEAVNPFIWQPSERSETSTEVESSASKTDDKKTKSDDKNTKDWVIDLASLSSRIMAIPIAPDAHHQIDMAKDTVYIKTQVRIRKKGRFVRRYKISSYHLKTRVFETLYRKQLGFSLTENRKWTLLLAPKNEVYVLETGAKIDEDDKSFKNGGLIDLERVQVRVKPEEEWCFMLKEAWRLQRDFFWDPKLSGLDWEGVYVKYAAILPKISSRSELNDLISEMQGELGSSHAYVWGGDLPERKQHPLGYLAANTQYNPQSKAHSITHITPRHAIHPDHAQVRSPLLEPGSTLNVGDKILAINGTPLCQEDTLGTGLINQPSGVLTLRIQRKHKKKAENIITRPLRCLKPLLYSNWVEKNRKTVAHLSKGRLGYLHIPDMQTEGFNAFMRGFLPQLERDGLIIDIRFNRGGHISTLLLQKIATQRFGMDLARWHSSPTSYPEDATKGNLVCLCNAYTASDGDMFAHAFKALKLGPLIGERTWGGVIGMSPRHPFLDGGNASQPEYAAWFEHIGYSIENHGVDPDLEVAQTPNEPSKDLQLLAAIDEAIKQIPNTQGLDEALEKSKRPDLRPRPLPKHA